MPTNPPPVIILADFVTGRITGGHQSDYLAALETAVAPLGTVTIAPYRDGDRRVGDLPRISPKTSRLGRYWESLRFFYRLFGNRRLQLVLFPSPEFRDFLVFFLASLLRVSRHNTIALFVFRRDAAGIVGRRSWKSRLIDRMVKWLAKRHYLYPVSDSKVALRYWEVLTGLSGSLVSIPVRQPAIVKPPKSPAEPLVIGLIGLFRLEKGAPLYDRVTETALASGTPAKVILQLNASGNAEEERLAAELRRKWQDAAKVEIINEHLDSERYAALLGSLDILVLPYDVASYGVGTSGIMFETLALGGVVAATRFEWGLERFQDHPNVIWMEDVEPATIQSALKEAAQLALAGPKAQIPDDFSETWHATIQRALAGLPKSRFDARPGC
ncbi:MAG: hypothetical protein ACPHIA_08595 [Alphaproteobacteria bacterium]